MLRVVGAVLLIGGTAFLGFSAAAALGRRVRTLRVLLGVLELMEREISFRLTPMPDLLEELARRARPPLRELFMRCREGVNRLGEKDLGQLWRDALEQIPLGLEGGRGQWSETLRRAEAERVQQGRMYGVLGLTAGAFLAIMLV